MIREPVGNYVGYNGILPIKEELKQKKIEEYFSRNERLGYTIFL